MKLIDFSRKFESEEACEKYLKEQREKEGIVCSKCGGRKHYWNRASKSWRCASCKHETRLTAGTFMHGSKLPLMYWFIAIHLLTSTKKTVSALEMQRQLGHKRYQPIWEMIHKLRSMMGQRDAKYQLTGSRELDNGYFTTDNPDNQQLEGHLKREIGSECKSKVLVMVESEVSESPKKGQKSRKCGHLKMKVMENLRSETLEKNVKETVDSNATVTMDDLRSHSGAAKAVKNSEQQVVLGKDTPKVLPWVHVAISNAKSLFTDMYHGVKDEFLQEYLNEFCYKFNRMHFGERLFDRLMLASISYRSQFEHRIYNKKLSSVCG